MMKPLVPLNIFLSGKEQGFTLVTFLPRLGNLIQMVLINMLNHVIVCEENSITELALCVRHIEAMT